MMKLVSIYTFALFCHVFFPACQQKQEPTAVKPELSDALKADLLKQGAEASAALFQELGPKLKAAMQSGGPEKAITVCKEVAQPTTLEVSNEIAKVKMTRVSLKPRNPLNAASPFDLETLQAWENRSPSNQQLPDPVVRMKDASMAVYYQPIVTTEICLKCHGDPETFPVSLKQKMHSMYPEDVATGYSVGDIRGAFRVEFPLQ